MQEELNIKVIKWICYGIVVSVMINIIYIFSLFLSLSICTYYITIAIISFLAVVVLKKEKNKHLFVAFFAITVTYMLSSMIIGLSPIIDYFYFLAYPASNEIAIGETFGWVATIGIGFVGIAASAISIISIKIFHFLLQVKSREAKH